MKLNILVFPCGSEVALEIYRSISNSRYFNLIGASSIADHGKYVFENYIEGLPFISDSDFIPAIKKLIKQYHIDYIYPSMDSVIVKLKEYEHELGCYVISAPYETTQICISKTKTYEKLCKVIKTPYIYDRYSKIDYPVFCKPEIGYGSRGAAKILNIDELNCYLNNYSNSLILEYLPGDEYTVDCFTDRNRKLLFYGPRKRNRVSNGISVNTYAVNDEDAEFKSIVDIINSSIVFRGAWFVQLKRNMTGNLVLLEIACRFGGSSSLFRAMGINFSQLSLFDAMGIDVTIIKNQYEVEMDRALDNKYKFKLLYNEVFIDCDDTLIIDEKYYNTIAIHFIYQCKNSNIKITLLSSHNGDLIKYLEQFNLTGLFDRVIHIKKCDKKSDYIDNKEAIFIDDSFIERKNVKENIGIPVFSIDMLEMLIK
jgi:hypothetical protein